MAEELVHLAGTRIAVRATLAFAFLADPASLARWAAGLLDQSVIAPGLVRGVLGASRRVAYCRVDPAPGHGTITYRLGEHPDELVPRIVAHVMAGEHLGRGPDECVVSLLAWRTADMDDARWASLRAGHEAEIDVIRGCLTAAIGPG